MFDVSKKIVDNVDRYKEIHYSRVKLKQDNWKLANDYHYFGNNVDDKWYFLIFKNEKNELREIKFKNDNNAYGIIESNGFIFSKYLIKNVYLEKGLIKGFYCWYGKSEPDLPTIDKNTGEITDWNIYQQNRVKKTLLVYL